MIVCQCNEVTVTAVYTGKVTLTSLQFAFFFGTVFVVLSTFCAESSFDVARPSKEAASFHYTVGLPQYQL